MADEKYRTFELNDITSQSGHYEITECENLQRRRESEEGEGCDSERTDIAAV